MTSIHVQHIGTDRLIALPSQNGEVWFRASQVRFVRGERYPMADGSFEAAIDISLGDGEHIQLTGEDVPAGGPGQISQLLWGDFHVDVEDAAAGGVG